MPKYSFDNSNPKIKNIHSGKGKAEVHCMIKNPKGEYHNFIRMVVLPSGASIGMHQHKLKDEEIYIIISGKGKMQEGYETFTVSAGDVVIHTPGREHSLENIGSEDLKLVVIGRLDKK